MIPRGQYANSASIPKTGLSALLCGLLRGRGSGTPKTGRGSGVSWLRGLVLALILTMLYLVWLTPGVTFAGPEVPAVSSIEDTTAAVATPSTEALVHGVLNPAGAGEAGTYKFLYKKSTSKTCTGESETTEGMIPTGEREEPAQTIAGLTPGTEYAICLRVENNAKTKSAISPAFTFTTPIHPETPTNLEANPLAATTATLDGTLNPGKAGNPGTYEFRYRKSASECEGGEGPTIVSGSATGGHAELVTAPIAELLPHTAYTFCLLARNEAGEESTLAGPVTFTTLVAPRRSKKRSPPKSPPPA